MRVPSCFLIAIHAWLAGAATLAIKVDQAGYDAKWPKIGIVESQYGAREFHIRRVKDGSVAFQGRLGTPVDDPDSGDRVAIADFSDLREIGSFYLDVPGIGTSWQFAIGSHVF